MPVSQKEEKDFLDVTNLRRTVVYRVHTFLPVCVEVCWGWNPGPQCMLNMRSTTDPPVPNHVPQLQLIPFNH